MGNLDYIRRKLTKCRFIYLAECGDYGIGIFAAKSFEQGEPIVVDEDGDYYKDSITEAEAHALGLDLSEHCFQIEHDRYLLPHGSMDDLINHSCHPTAGIVLTAQGYRLVALRSIAPGEQITYDYSTYISNPRERLVCSCGSAQCRGIIGPFADLPIHLQAYYISRGVVGGFAAAE
jgi:hypothetical protein